MVGHITVSGSASLIFCPFGVWVLKFDILNF